MEFKERVPDSKNVCSWLRGGIIDDNSIGFTGKLHQVTVAKLTPTADFYSTVHPDLFVGNTEFCLSTILHSICKFQQLGKTDGFSFNRY